MTLDNRRTCFSDMLKIKWGLTEIIGITFQDWRLYVCMTQRILYVSHLNIFIDLLFLVGTQFDPLPLKRKGTKII